MRTILALTLIATVLLPANVYAETGSLYLAPSDGIYSVGEVFDIRVLADTDGESANAIEGELAYNPQDFSVEGISTEQSILHSWSTAPSYDGAAGIIKFSGWAEQPFSGRGGLLLTIHMRPLRVAQSPITFNSGAMLAANGQGTNLLGRMSAGGYTISPRQEAPPAPLQAQSTVPEATQSSDLGVSSAAVSRAFDASNQVAFLPNTGADILSFAGIFFVFLTLIAFVIAYVLHRLNRATASTSAQRDHPNRESH